MGPMGWMELDAGLGEVGPVQEASRSPGPVHSEFVLGRSVGRFLYLYCIREQTLYYVVDLLGTSSTGDHVLRPRENYNRY